MLSETSQSPHYESAGVSTGNAEAGLARLVDHIRGTWPAHPAGDGAVKLDLGYFASVVDIGGIGIAICTDGIGTKALVAQLAGKYDTVGIDCVAMNVNDLICVGATPITMVDYVAVERADPEMLAQLGAGLADGARQARISITGGEIAQMRDIAKGARPGAGFDLAGTAIGRVALDRINAGRAVADGDSVIGIASNGIHSNGLSLARRVLFGDGGLDPESRVDGLSAPLALELLRPTHIYVREALDLLESDIEAKALIHITGDGFLNLARVASDAGFVIDTLPPVPPIFAALQRIGGIADRELFQVFNMGIGFCVVVAPRDEARALAILGAHGKPCQRIGVVQADAEKRVWLTGPKLVGRRGEGFKPDR